MNKQKIKKVKCYYCKRKSKLSSLLFTCRCCNKFCRKCLLPEIHNCDFDYKKLGKEQLIKNNKKVEFTKIIKI